MNDVYFACESCRVMVEAGYRWAYWELEHCGVVQHGAPVAVAAVRAAGGYWRPGGDPASQWLNDKVLPVVWSFLDAHVSHALTYGDVEEVAGIKPQAVFDWLDVSHSPELTPRYFCEIQRLHTWENVVSWVNDAPRKPWWWGETKLREAARTKFEALALAAAHGAPENLGTQRSQ